ncbi:MAG: hypothetical protein JO144_08585 [Actinobacteria bacterium]|nr:hypothetical protein [Actinomycetota bacterium]
MQVLTVFLTFIGVVRDIPGAVLNWLSQTTAHVPTSIWAVAAVLAVLLVLAVARTKPASR